MNRVDDLIARLSPTGVGFRALGDLLAYEQPTKYLVHSTAYDDSYGTPVLTAGQTFILGYTAESDDVFPASTEAPVIIFDDFTTAFRWVDFPFKAKSSAMKMLRPHPNAQVNFKFVYYAMLCIRFTPSDHERHWISQYSKFRIPVPPLEVQHQIVKVLDTFTDLESELEAELEARQRQYGYYRDLLMALGAIEGVRWTTMGEAGVFIRGRRFTKDDVVSEGIGSIHYGEIYTQYGTWAAKTVSRVRSELAPRLRFARTGDVVIATVGETVDEVCKAVAWVGDEDVAVHDDCVIFRHSMNPKFVSYYMQTRAFHAEKAKYVSRAKVKRVSAEGLARLRIPVPPFVEQERIVSILDKFDKLANDLSIGLPAELNARRQQYEHYRVRLLTFSEAA